MKKDSSLDQVSIKTFGNSMYPFFHNQDIVYLNKVPFKELKINDFITFKVKDTFITHRVIYIPYKNSNWLYTKGDNNLQKDRKVFYKNVVGKVTKIRRNRMTIDPTQLYFFQSSLYLEEIKKITSLFFKNKINFIFLKGLPLNLYYEREYPKRIYADCDLLIEKKDFGKSLSLLKKFGYIWDRSIKSENEMSYYKRISGFRVILDLHTESVFLSMHSLGKSDLLYPQTLLNTFTRNCLLYKRTITIKKIKIPMLSLPYLIIYLMLHLFHHHYKGYYRYTVLEKILKNTKTIPYKEMMKIINDLKIEGYIYPGFLFLSKYYNIKFPYFFLSQIQPDKEKKIFIQKNIVSLDIFNDSTKNEEGVKKFKSVFFLSPNNIIIKSLIFLNPKVLTLIIHVLIIRLRRKFIFLNNFIFS